MVIFLIQCAVFHSEKNIIVFIVAIVTTGVAVQGREVGGKLRS